MRSSDVCHFLHLESHTSRDPCLYALGNLREGPGAGKPHARICEGEAEWPSYSTGSVQPRLHRVENLQRIRLKLPEQRQLLLRIRRCVVERGGVHSILLPVNRSSAANASLRRISFREAEVNVLIRQMLPELRQHRLRLRYLLGCELGLFRHIQGIGLPFPLR